MELVDFEDMNMLMEISLSDCESLSCWKVASAWYVLSGWAAAKAAVVVHAALKSEEGRLLICMLSA